MTGKRRSIRRLVPLGALALVAGVAGAQAAGSGQSATTPQQPPATRAMTVAATTQALPAAATVMLVNGRIMSVPQAPSPPAYAYYGGAVMPAPSALPVPAAIGPCDPRDRPAASRNAPSDALLEAFGILRRERNDEDALPARALASLKAAGLGPVDPRSARLLRSDGGARAWVVPVPDVDAGRRLACLQPRRAVREGLAVVSVGAAPAGGGGALRELQRGLAPASLDPCAGTARNMLGISGLVPDGVEAVFVTGADGSATRADVEDNSFAFVLPWPRRPEQRYVVWTGSDGKPHVQPLPYLVSAGLRRICERSGVARRAAAPRVTPDPFAVDCAPVPSVLSMLKRIPAARARSLRAQAQARARRLRALRRASPRRPSRSRAPARRAVPPRPAPLPATFIPSPSLLPVGPCGVGSMSSLIAPGVLYRGQPTPMTVPPRPARPRAPRAATTTVPKPSPRPPRGP